MIDKARAFSFDGKTLEIHGAKGSMRVNKTDAHRLINTCMLALKKPHVLIPADALANYKLKDPKKP